MDYSTITSWFKTTIPGIVLLGAAGSILALWIGRLFGPAILWVVRAPIRFHVGRHSFQAFLLGFSSAHIAGDKTDRRLIAFIGYHLMKLIFFAVAAATAWLTFLILALAPGPLLTITSYASVVVFFIALYGAYFESEFILRIFLWQWKSGLEIARKGYLDRNESADAQEKPIKNNPYP